MEPLKCDYYYLGKMQPSDAVNCVHPCKLEGNHKGPHLTWSDKTFQRNKKGTRKFKNLEVR